MENYRPISLIDNDLKLFTKVLGKHFSSFIPHYVHKDQVGFILGRQLTWSPLCRRTGQGAPPQEGLLPSLDQQKAFDSVSWPYMFEVLKMWGFGP